MTKVLSWLDKNRKPATKGLGWLDKNQKTAAWVAASLLFILLNYLKNVVGFPWDAGQYWELSSFDELLHNDGIRGYFYPLLLSPIRYLSGALPSFALAPYRIISSTTYAYVFAWLLPDFYHSVFGGRLGFWRRLLVPALMAMLFPGLFVYTLSDLPAFALMVGAMASAMSSINSERSRFSRYSLLMLAGLLAYGAYNTRTIYLFPVLLFIPAVAVIIYRDHPVRVKSTVVTLLVTGSLIASLPQLYINVGTRGAWSPAVISDKMANLCLPTSSIGASLCSAMRRRSKGPSAPMSFTSTRRAGSCS